MNVRTNGAGWSGTALAAAFAALATLTAATPALVAAQDDGGATTATATAGEADSRAAADRASSASAQQSRQQTTVGPANGSLVVVGGALSDPAIVRRFIALAGGPEAPIVIIPTAGGGDDADYGEYCTCRRLLRENGATNLTVLHTYDPEEADTEAFVEPLLTARGVWFPGGRQWRLADSYLGTRTERALQGVLDRGGVIGGSSAGATILGSYLVRGDTRTNAVMMGDHTEGLGYLRNTAVDQHLLRRNRQFDMLEVIEAHPELLGIGLDENTAIVVQGDRFEVMGQGYVAIYDHGAMLDGGGRFYFLAPGDRFDMAERQATRPGRDFEPLDRVERRSWGEGGGGGGAGGEDGGDGVGGAGSEDGGDGVGGAGTGGNGTRVDTGRGPGGGV